MNLIIFSHELYTLFKLKKENDYLLNLRFDWEIKNFLILHKLVYMIINK